MKKHTILVYIIASLAVIAAACKPLKAPTAPGTGNPADKIFTGNGSVTEIYGISRTSDNGYILSGYTPETPSAINDDAAAIRLDSSGAVLWSRTYGFPGLEDEARSAVETPDGGFLICGGTDQMNSTTNSVFLIKTDAAGNSLWTQTFNYPGCPACNSYVSDGFQIIKTSDSGYAITGGAPPFIVKLDSSFNVSWQKAYYNMGAPDLLDTFSSIMELPSGGYAICGEWPKSAGGEACIIAADASGNCVWVRTYSLDSYSYPSSIIPAQDGGYIMSGYVSDSTTAVNRTFICKTNASGDMLWNRYFLDSVACMGSSVCSVPGAYIISGISFNASMAGAKGYAVKTALDGSMMWSNTYKTAAYDTTILFAICGNPDGSAVLAGVTGNYMSGPALGYYTKINGGGGRVW